MRFTSICACVTVSISLVMPTPRAAAEPPSPGRATQDNMAEYEFGDDQVWGELVSPLGEVLTVRRKRGKDSLVRARGSFVDNLLRTVEDL